MRVMRVIPLIVLLLVIGGAPPRAEQPGAIEPTAGKWKTWLIASGAELRTAPPPNGSAADQELEELVRTAANRDQATLDRIAYWDTGAPSYRWSEIAIAEHLKNGIGWPLASRNLALMHIAIYDALVAAWDSKYAYSRPRPSKAAKMVSGNPTCKSRRIQAPSRRHSRLLNAAAFKQPTLSGDASTRM